jgi:mannose-6-phosphate isomerase-like protein (cupin superfamily)
MATARVVHPDPSAEYFFKEGCHISEWWNRDDDTTVSIARARVEPGMTTRWHRLSGIAERYVILSGSGRVEVEGIDAETVGPGAVVLIPPGAAQRISNSGDVDLVFLAICTPRFVREAYRDVED